MTSSHSTSAKDQKRGTELSDFPVIDLTNYLTHGDKKASKECKLVAQFLHQYGILIVRDPRVHQRDNDIFLDVMEKYYGRSDEEKVPDVRKELSYQVGLTPAGVEQARNNCDIVAKLEKSEKPETICPPGVDPKVRFFWRIGDRPEKTEFPSLNAEPVVPKDIPEWSKVLDTWGTLILTSVHTVAEMAAIGFDLKKDTFTKMMNNGPHLLAPTGSDIGKWNKLGTAFASFHTDLNFLTIHGKSRFPGLFVWTREGKKVSVRVPEGCLLLQAGKQFEYLTGGEVLAGFHEVVVTENTLKAAEVAKKSGKSLWRVSSTLFSHIASDEILKPLSSFTTKETVKKYPPIKAGHQVRLELEAINLRGASSKL